MKSNRELSRRPLHFEMMVFMLILAFPRETEGATFFHQYEKIGNHTLNCSGSGTKYVWYRGKDSSSLLQFEAIWRDQNKTSLCAADSRDTEKIVGGPAFSAGGIFACTLWTENSTCPLFTNNSHCSNFDFFIVVIRNRTEEDKFFGPLPEQTESVRSIPEKGNFTLTCELQIKDNSMEFALYWIKGTAPSICLFSATSEGHHGPHVSLDVNCCVDAAVEQRRTSNSVQFHGWLHHNLTIFNASSSDSGMYLCVVTAWKSKRVWKIARNVSIEVKNSTLSPHRSINEFQIPLGVIGGIILICGITGLIYWKKKVKGNPVEEQPRNQVEMEMEEDDCSPYAMISRNDVDRNEALYLLLKHRPEARQGTSPSSDGKPASQSGVEVHTVYALVSK